LRPATNSCQTLRALAFGEMADKYLIPKTDVAQGAPVPENSKKKLERNEALYKEKTEALKVIRQKRREARHELKMRTIKYIAEYKAKEDEVTAQKRLAKETGGFYREEDAKVVFVVRIKGINKLAPKPKKILQLFRLRQLHNGVFIKVNKATTEMLKCIQPYVTYGYPSLSTVRQLVYKRGYAKVGPQGARQRVRIQTNDIISTGLGKYGIHGVEDLVHELYTCGSNFKEANNFLWPFKLSSPRKGFVAKRHGFNEARKGDWGNREKLVNELLKRMM